jgi:hypothetical protein
LILFVRVFLLLNDILTFSPLSLVAGDAGARALAGSAGISKDDRMVLDSLDRVSYAMTSL